MPFPPGKRYLLRSAWCSTIQGSRHTWTLQKKHSFEHSFFPATQLFPLCVGCFVGWRFGWCVVVMLLSLSLLTLLPCCQHCCRCHRWHAAASTTTVGWQGGWHLLHKHRQQPRQVGASCLPGVRIPCAIRPAPPGRSRGWQRR